MDLSVHMHDNSRPSRKERNKQAAAKSRANRKALFAQMQSIIDELKAQNASLVLRLKELQQNEQTPQPIIYSTELFPWCVDMPSYHGHGASESIIAYLPDVPLGELPSVGEHLNPPSDQTAA